jgi:DNA-binding response OmpR family regulator
VIDVTDVLLIEDEDRIAEFIKQGLRLAGYSCEIIADGLEGLREAESGAYQLILLDVGLPNIDGFEILRRLRVEDQTTPVIMLTARDSSHATVLGLESGANDYLPKPFAFDELLARIRLRLREAVQRTVTELRHGPMVLDLRARTATIGDRAVELSAREFALAEEFFRQPGEILTREHLLRRVWGYEFDPGTNVVDVYVRYLRNKLGADRIESVRGIGYRLV